MSFDVEKLTKEIKRMSPEEFEKEILHLNGRMTQELFDKVMNELFNKLILNDESISYHENDYSISWQDFSDVFHYLEVIAGEDKYDISNSFPYTQASFEYKGIKFIWDLLIGQGSSCSLYVYGYNDEQFREDKKIIIKEINSNIKFYKQI